MSLRASKTNLKQPLTILLGLLVFMWALEFIDLIFLSGRLDLLGIRPRSLVGLRGLIFAPFLHGGWAHIIGNSIPFLVLGFFVMIHSIREFVEVTVIVALVGGFGTWLLGGANTVHIGASILIFGYLGFLLAEAYYERSVAAIILALLAGFLYGGMLWGVLPIRTGVSWQGHLFGFIGGVVAARFATEVPKGLES